MTDLFTPLSIGAMALPNRIIMAPMTRNRAPESIPVPLMATYYSQRAEAGLLITEGSQISTEAVGYPGTPGIHTDAQVDGWKLVTDAVHAKGGRIFLQLWHCGRASHPDFHGGKLPVAPSAIAPTGKTFTYEGLKDFVSPRALDTSEIPRVVSDYASAAKNALSAGFDGVEIHAANGYLIDQFLRDGCNQRSDHYGGSVENRARFLMEVTEAVVNVCGSDKVGLRLSPLNPFNDIQDSDPQTTFTYAVKALNRFHLAYLHVTEMGAENPGLAGPSFDIQELRTLWEGVYIPNGGYDKARTNIALEANTADAVAFGMAYLANPDLVERFRKDAELNVANEKTLYVGGETGYTDYPFLGNQ
ncbi:MAG: alkene reductase [Pseudomonadales bacterium]|nr:alkene reductase [Pseudomonadales bacterium]